MISKKLVWPRLVLVVQSIQVELTFLINTQKSFIKERKLDKLTNKCLISIYSLGKKNNHKISSIQTRKSYRIELLRNILFKDTNRKGWHLAKGKMTGLGWSLLVYLWLSSGSVLAPVHCEYQYQVATIHCLFPDWLQSVDCKVIAWFTHIPISKNNFRCPRFGLCMLLILAGNTWKRTAFLVHRNTSIHGSKGD